jgi:two-component system sensor histidine kinase UhpB
VTTADRAEPIRRLQLVVDEQERERAYVAHRLHDDMAQSLASVLLGLEALERRVPHAEGACVAWLRAELAEALRLCTEVAVSLRPPILDQLGLEPALRSLAGRADAKAPSIDPRLAGMEVGPQLETGIYRVVEEALGAAKPPRGLAVSLDAGGRELALTATGSAIGNIGRLEARVELLGGTLEPAVGAVGVRIPLRARPPLAAFPQPRRVETPDGAPRALP